MLFLPSLSAFCPAWWSSCMVAQQTTTFSPHSACDFLTRGRWQHWAPSAVKLFVHSVCCPLDVEATPLQMPPCPLGEGLKRLSIWRSQLPKILDHSTLLRKTLPGQGHGHENREHHGRRMPNRSIDAHRQDNGTKQWQRIQPGGESTQCKEAPAV